MDLIAQILENEFLSLCRLDIFPLSSLIGRCKRSDPCLFHDILYMAHMSDYAHVIHANHDILLQLSLLPRLFYSRFTSVNLGQTLLA